MAVIYPGMQSGEGALDPGVFFNPGAGASSLTVQPKAGVASQSPIPLGLMAAMIGPGNAAVQYTAATPSGSFTATAAQISGGNETILAISGTSAAQTMTLPTVASLYANLPYAAVGQGYILTLINNNTASGAITIATATGWTLNVGVAVAINSVVDFAVLFTGATTATLQRLASRTV